MALTSSGLKLLQDYESDEEEEVIAIGGAENEGEQSLNKVQTSVLPLPQELLGMYSISKTKELDDQDDPALHDGRVRSFPHRRGNWVSFLGISLNSCDSVAQQCEIFLKACREIPDTGFKICSDFHLSLTKTLVFRHHWIDPFLASLKEPLGKLQTFDLIYDRFEVYVNDEKSRTFIGMKVHSSANLHSLIRIADKTLAEFDLEHYYEEPSFHVSIGWTLGDKSAEVKNSLLNVVNKLWNDMLAEDISLQRSKVATVQFKTGNKLYEFHLEG